MCCHGGTEAGSVSSSDQGIQYLSGFQPLIEIENQFQ
jgi:hypothetical protein